MYSDFTELRSETGLDPDVKESKAQIAFIYFFLLAKLTFAIKRYWRYGCLIKDELFSTP